MNLDDLKAKPRFFGMFIGDPGTGKTVQACSFPGPLYVFDCDNRMRPVLELSWQPQRYYIRYVPSRLS